MRLVACLGLLALTLNGVSVAHAQPRVSGDASFLVTAFPGGARTPEARPRVRARVAGDAGTRVHYDLSAYAEGLASGGRSGSTAGRAEVSDAALDLPLGRVDVRVGFTRVVWGRLDEVQPSDVVNPLDLGQFFLDSRDAARLPVGLVRARAHLSESASVEAVVVPGFRSGRFDRLDEATSPFRPAPTTVVPVTYLRPNGPWHERVQGGARFSTTSGRVDWAVGAYRGLRAFRVYDVVANPIGGPAVDPLVTARGQFASFRMISGDFETAFRRWAVRGELTLTSDDALQASNVPVSGRGRTLQAGLGADRTVAGYRVLAQVLTRLVDMDADVASTMPVFGVPVRYDTRTVSAVGVVERRFHQDTRLLRLFTLYDASSRNALVRGSGSVAMRDDLSVEGTAAIFAGRARGFLGPFVDRDFVSLRLTKRF